jgi:polynucleotide 5'-hydroxyl-kinase GRC3/NOL9
MNINLIAGQGIQITGPAKVRVIEGKLSLLGSSVSLDSAIIIREGKHFPFEAEKDSTIELEGLNPQYVITEEPLIPLDRKEVSKRISEFPSPIKIMVLGDVDTGKTTVICYLANYFFSLGKRVAVIDLDIGQQDIGPPCTITLGLLDRPILKLSDIPLHRMIFIGKTSPSGRMVPFVSGARELVDYALTIADVVLIDTTGWVFGSAARSLKTAKIHALKPQFLVALQKDHELDHLLKPFELSTIHIENLSVFPQIIPRDHQTRTFLRESGFNNYFKDASTRMFNLQNLRIQDTLYGTGQVLNDEALGLVEQVLGCKVIYGEKAADALFVVKIPQSVYDKNCLDRVKTYFGVQEIRIVNKNEEKGLVIGLLDKDFKTLGIGIIESIHYRENEIRIFTPVTEDVQILQFGSLKITKTGQEIKSQDFLF